MSWEEFKYQKTCPCSKGKYTITRQENDWGKSHLWFKMNCESCQNTYVQFTSHYHDPGAPGGTSSSDFWVLKEDKQALDDLQKQIKREKEAILSMGQARYLQRWLDTFVDKPKKRIWAELKSIAHHCVPSLGTFYTRTKDESLEDYLREWFDAEKLISILDFLGIHDSELPQAYAQLNEQSQNSEGTERQMLSRAVHIL